MRRSSEIILGIGLAAIAAGCIGREVAEVDPGQNKEQYKDIPVLVNRDIDILFIVDNSGSMTEEQASLVSNFSRFINVLETIQGGLPNVHIGVVSTDVGAGPFNIQGCTGNGDNGILQNAPRQGGCSPPAGKFISDIANADGSRQQNYTGQLSETFTCIAQLGINGCGFEQQLESMRRALNGSNNENGGFLRPDAFLAVIFITDEDDCSTENTQMFDTSQTGVDDPLGPLSSFRCFEFGVVCNPDNPRTPGAKTECLPRNDSDYMYGVQQYVDFLKQLKDEDLIIVAGIIGNPSPVVVGANMNGEPQLEPSCVSASGEAAPSVRLKTFLDAFRYTTTTTICNEDLSDALINIADLLAEVIGNPCLDGNLSEPLDCVVYDVVNQNEPNETQTLVPRCDNTADPESSSNLPCWNAHVDTMACGNTPSGLVFQVYPENRSVALGTHTIVRCAAD